MKRLRAVVSGTVQGVGYRASVYKNMRGVNVGGYVKNLPDSTVEIVAEGTKEELDKVLDIAKKGSMLSTVRDVKTEYSEPAFEFVSFEIAH